MYVVVRGKERVGGISPEVPPYIHEVAEIQAPLEWVAECHMTSHVMCHVIY